MYCGFMPFIGLLVRIASKKMRKLSIQVQNTMGDVEPCCARDD